MLFDLSASDIQNHSSSKDLPTWLAFESDGLHVSGDRVSLRETFVWHSDDRALISTRAEELLAQLDVDSRSPGASPFSISQALTYGIVPMPHTAYNGVQRLGPGDTFTLTAPHGRIESHLEYSYPWLSRLSREDHVPDTSKFRELIGESLERQLTAAGGTGMLMLSSGKDSVALALALADRGQNNVPCFTLTAGPEDTEHIYAAQLCARLGLEHHTVAMPESQETVKAAMIHFFENSPLPSVDHATIPYTVAVHTSGPGQGGLIDGCGNDSYMGYVPLGRTVLKSTLRVRNRRIAKMIRSRISHDSPVNYFTRSRVATYLQGRMFRNAETQRFYGDAVDTENHWYELSRDVAGLDLVDFLGASEVRLTDTGKSNAKVYLVAHANGLEPVLPYCDNAIADYYFNLPQNDRIDLSGRKNKLLLRQLLRETIDYDPAVVGSNHFGFDSSTFLQNHEGFVRDEILSCDLWLPEVESDLNFWLAELPKRPFLSHSLVALFMISGWHNHYPSIERKRR